MALTSLNTSLIEGFETMNQTQLEFNLQKFNLSTDNEQIGEIAAEIEAGTKRLKERLEEFERRLAPSTQTKSAVLLLQVVFDMLSYLMTIVLLFALIRTGSWLYWLPPIITISSQGVEGFNITDTISSLMPSFSLWDLLPVFEWEQYVEYTKIVLAVVILIMATYFSLLRRVYLSTYTCTTDEVGSYRFWLLITFKITKHCLWGQHEQLITLRVPVRAQFPEETVSLEINRTKLLWFISTKLRIFSSVQPITIRGLLDTGHYSAEFSETLSIPLGSIRFDGFCRPYNFYTASFGTATVISVGDQSPLF